MKFEKRVVYFNTCEFFLLLKLNKHNCPIRLKNVQYEFLICRWSLILRLWSVWTTCTKSCWISRLSHLKRFSNIATEWSIDTICFQDASTKRKHNFLPGLSSSLFCLHWKSISRQKCTDLRIGKTNFLF